MHQHRVAVSKDRAWTHCVEGYDCSDDRAHGNIERVEWCTCGAERHKEINQRFEVVGGWIEPHNEMEAR